MIEKPITHYECEVCHRVYKHHEDAEKCEADHAERTNLLKVGATVTVDRGSYFSEQGQRSPSWWPNPQPGTVIENRGESALIEFKDGTRTMVDGYSIQRQVQVEKRNQELSEYITKYGHNVASSGTIGIVT